MDTPFPKGAALSRRLRELIPGGAHAYSKAPSQWPARSPKVLSHGKGAWVWDADGNAYVDWFTGLTAVSLGHAYAPVVERVRRQLELGNSFQLPTALEYEAAASFLGRVARADMVKFAKDGSTCNDAAIRLARGVTGRKYVVKCAQHPFFSYGDWFIGQTLCSTGTLPEAAAYTLDFAYNNLDDLAAQFARHPGEVACVILEPVRFDPPAEGFLQGVRRLCDEHGALLVLDEVVTGMKYHLGGAQALFGVEPDLTTWGKGIANGFSVSALTGRRELMSRGDTNAGPESSVFLLSTTHGAEACGLAALLATVEAFAASDVIGENYRTGARLRLGGAEILRESGIEQFVRFVGYDCFLGVEFRDADGRESRAFKTLFVQELCRHGVLFRGIFYPTLSHRDAELDLTLEAFRRAAKVYQQALVSGPGRFLVGPSIVRLL